ncbi:MAG: hypothetical protein SVU32_07990 [Candidatus Nanohaloarchaea archaeon]|nr:hypothetical protein [Candidatus Nanohaloarchaea archaeon]
MINIPDVYPDDEVDQTSYCILLRVEEMDASWKREIYRELNNWRRNDLCPINVTDEVSLQTVCRRVDKLEDMGLLEKTPVYSERTNQYMDMYQVTEAGEEAIERITHSIVRNLLKEYVEHSIDGKDLILEDGLFDKLERNTYSPISGPDDLRKQATQNIENPAGIRVS